MSQKQKNKQFTDEEISRLCLELSLFVRSGMDLGAGLEYISEKHRESPRADSILKLSADVSSGIPLSVAFGDSELFPKDAVAMVKVGETTGRLEEALLATADFYEKRAAVSHRVRAALLYPTVLFAVMLAVIVLLLTKVLPIFNDVYASIGGSLSGVSAFLLQMGQLLRLALPGLAVLVVGAAAVFALLLKRGTLKKHLQKHPIAVAYRNAGFAKALHMGIASGLSLTEAVENAGGLYNEEAVADCLRRMDNGTPLADAMGEAGLLPAAECDLLALGLHSGSGEDISRRIAEQLEVHADAVLEKQISAIEPVLVLIASLLVGAVLISVMLPLTGLLTGMV